jgi:hypothetical protein
MEEIELTEYSASCAYINNNFDGGITDMITSFDAIQFHQKLPLLNSLPSSSKDTIKIKTCISCNKSATNKGICGHYYCNECIRNFCLVSLKDRSFLPVRCCKLDFPHEWVQFALNPIELKQYEQFQKELQNASIKQLDPSFATMVSKNGWKLCSKCGAGIEKTMVRYSIT